MNTKRILLAGLFAVLLIFIAFQSHILNEQHEVICEQKCRIVELENSRIKMFRYFVYDEGDRPTCPPDCTEGEYGK